MRGACCGHSTGRGCSPTEANRMSRHALGGKEFDWFATDGAGHIAHFATAGFGPIPAVVVARLDDLRDVDQRVLTLPVSCDATGHLDGAIEDWLAMARRGLFSYDWQHWAGPYRLAATPGRPISVGDLP